MRVQITSDLHTEFYRGAFKPLLETLDPTGIDVLVVAGDVGCIDDHSMRDSLLILAQKYPHVVFVTGNHEYYNSSKYLVDETLKVICPIQPNLHWLNHSSVEINGQRFIGSTLWFRDDAMNEAYARGLNDFRVINGFRHWVYKENELAIKNLEDNIREGDFVVTHHLPSQLCVDPQFKGSDLNRFFVCEMDDVIQAKKPAHWVFGHTHGSHDFMIDQTRVLANPYGYPQQLNPDYKQRLVIEL